MTGPQEAHTILGATAPGVALEVLLGEGPFKQLVDQGKVLLKSHARSACALCRRP